MTTSPLPASSMTENAGTSRTSVRGVPEPVTPEPVTAEPGVLEQAPTSTTTPAAEHALLPAHGPGRAHDACPLGTRDRAGASVAGVVGRGTVRVAAARRTVPHRVRSAVVTAAVGVAPMLA